MDLEDYLGSGVWNAGFTDQDVKRIGWMTLTAFRDNSFSFDGLHIRRSSCHRARIFLLSLCSRFSEASWSYYAWLHLSRGKNSSNCGVALIAGVAKQSVTSWVHLWPLCGLISMSASGHKLTEFVKSSLTGTVRGRGRRDEQQCCQFCPQLIHWEALLKPVS